MEASFQRDLNTLLGRRPELRLVTLADGAPEMQGILDRATASLPVETRLVDVWHLLEHLANGIDATGRFVQDQLADWKDLLFQRDDAIERIEETLLTWAHGYPSDARPAGLHAALTYITNQRERLRYASARAAGLPVGSGTVEATGKAIVQVRMKRPGARWRPAGAQAIMGLRALAKSSPERWDGAVRRVLATYKADVKPKRAKKSRR